MTARPEFLVLLDRGKLSALWAVLRAASESEIRDRYPELQVVAATPDWMTDENYQNLRQNFSFDIEDDSNTFVAVILDDRKRS